MPTYTCWAVEGGISTDARKAIAHLLTELHHEVAVGPRYFVQVVFNDLRANSIYIAGSSAEPGHVWIRADIRAGRSDAQKRELLARITTEVGSILGVSPERIWVYINDIPGASIAEYGRPLPDPGGEDAWFADLPDDLQQRLEGLK